MKTGLVLSGLSALLSTAALAHCRNHTVSTIIATSIQYTSKQCEVGDALALARCTHDYPLLGELEVDYWNGSYRRPARETDTVRIDTYDCDGNVIDTWTQERTQDIEVEFPIDNPNLHDNVDKTFEANAPMTDAEAKSALAEAKRSCESARSMQNAKP